MPDARPVPESLRLRPFTTADAHACGITRRMLSASRFERLYDGVYIVRGAEVTLDLQIDAALLILPKDAAATHLTGLATYGIDVGDPRPLRFATTSRHAVRRDGIRVIRRMSMPRHGTRILSAPDCWLDACVDLDLVRAVAAGDRMVRVGLASVQELVDFVARIDNWEGITLAREAVALVRSGVESPRETYVRLMLVLAGLPEPACNIDVVVEGRFLGRGDLVYLRYRIIVEYDGRQHAEDTYQWNRDLDRLDGFADHGWLCERVTNPRLNDPRRVVTRVYELLRRQGYTGPPPQFDERWSRLFERRTVPFT